MRARVSFALSPARRGEAGSEGQPEIYWGEVDDALASIEYLAKLDVVDPAQSGAPTSRTSKPTRDWRVAA